MQFWGVKTEALFDVWSVEHFITGICTGWLAARVQGKLQVDTTNNIRLDYYIKYSFVLLMAAMWEVMEHYLETGLAGAKVAYWFQGVEHPLNRMLTDPLLLMLGAAFYFRNKGVYLYARVFSVLWLLVHIFIFPHSMYMQHYF